MNLLAHYLAYGAILVFVAAVAVRFWRIRSYPINIRWEIYPIPHEGARSAHGGSKMEEGNYWEKKHKPSKITEMKFMFWEMIFIKGLWDHNRKLWFRSFPFHFGLYMLAGFIGLLVVGAVLNLAGIPVNAQAAGIGQILTMATVVLGLCGMVLSLLGAIGLFLMRLSDEDLRPYTNASHFFNLLFIMAAEVLGLIMWQTADPDFSLCRKFIAGLIPGSSATPVESGIVNATIIVASLLIAYIPLTHMSHFFVKWFTWHKIRWDDSEYVKGGRIHDMIMEALMYRPGWKAPHIAGDGKRTWADVATEETKQ